MATGSLDQFTQYFPYLEATGKTGGGLIAGYVFGVTAKKIVKIIIGIGIAIVAALEVLKAKGYIGNWRQFFGGIDQKAIQTAQTQAQSTFKDFLGMAEVGGGFTVGAVLGFRRG